MAPQSELRLIKRCAEFIPRDKIKSFARGLRGIYVLYQHEPRRNKYNVLYVGMATTGRRGGIRGRLWNHHEKKGRTWSHFSVFEVWDNIRQEEIAELEGLFRHLYRKDAQANQLNVQKGFRKLRRLRENNLRYWGKELPQGA
jgi:hypothetical protein